MSIKDFIKPADPIGNEKGAALLVVVIVGIFIAIFAFVTIISTKNSAATISIRRNDVSAFNIAEAGKEHALMRIRNDSMALQTGANISILNNCPFNGGTYTVEYDANAAIDTLWIRSTGIFNNQSARVSVICVEEIVYSHVNPTIEAAVTTRSEITVSGNCTIDGRDWDPDSGKIVDSTGVLGIKSCGALTQKNAASMVGGNGSAPANPAMVGSYEHLVSPVGYPTTPEEILGLPAGTLDSYITKTLPSFPVYNTIIYFDPSDLNKHELNFPDMQGSTGIFICHTTACDASIKNVNTNFKGIIIADQVNHINAGTAIYGAVFTLSPASGTNAFGNGNSGIYYSSKVINQIKSSITVPTGTNYAVISWKQLQ